MSERSQHDAAVAILGNHNEAQGPARFVLYGCGCIKRRYMPEVDDLPTGWPITCAIRDRYDAMVRGSGPVQNPYNVQMAACSRLIVGHYDTLVETYEALLNNLAASPDTVLIGQHVSQEDIPMPPITDALNAARIRANEQAQYARGLDVAPVTISMNTALRLLAIVENVLPTTKANGHITGAELRDVGKVLQDNIDAATEQYNQDAWPV